eukprot:232045-Pelagomonas_calceolata.AAC.4
MVIPSGIYVCQFILYIYTRAPLPAEASHIGSRLPMCPQTSAVLGREESWERRGRGSMDRKRNVGLQAFRLMLWGKEGVPKCASPATFLMSLRPLPSPGIPTKITGVQCLVCNG